LARVLDGIRNEAKGTKFESRYAIGSVEIGEIWQARSRAYIHLYLKVMYGMADFDARENFVTDGTQDGGIDGYFIDVDSKASVFLIQSKFRNTEENFETKPISLDDLLSMQIKRIVSGETSDEHGIRYNGKIIGLQRRIGEIPDLGRYTFQVILIANTANISKTELTRLAD
jgi:hypothetical protein